MNLKKKLTPVGILTLSLDYIHVYDLVYIYQTLGEHLQDHWSSGYPTFFGCHEILSATIYDQISVCKCQ